MSEQPTPDELEARFSKFIKKRGLRNTMERFAILARVRMLRSHFEVDDLYRKMEDDGFHVSRATVYNTVGLLCQCGILRCLHFDGRQSRYEMALENHLHLVCTECGAIREVDDSGMLATLEKMRFPRFSPYSVSATVNGVCSRCRRKRKPISRGAT